MQGWFSDDMRRDPYPLYERMRGASPVQQIPNDHDTFSSRVPAPPHWFTFLDPPDHTRLRALISQAFTPRVIASLEPRIRELSRGLLDRAAGRGEMDLAAEYSVPLPMMVIAGMIGMPAADWPRFSIWSQAIPKLSYTRSGGEEAG